MKPNDTTGQEKTKKQKQGLGPLPDDARSLGQSSQARIPWGRGAPAGVVSRGRSWGRRRDGGEDRLGKVQGGLTLPPVNRTAINQNQPSSTGGSAFSSTSVSTFTSSWGTPQHQTHELVIPQPTKRPAPPKAYGGASVSTASTQSMTDASGSVSTGTSNRSSNSGMVPPLSVPTYRGSSSPGAHTAAATAPTAFGFSQQESQTTSQFTAPSSVNCGASVQTDFSSLGTWGAATHPYHHHHDPSPSLATHDEPMLPASTAASPPVAAPAAPIPFASPSPAPDLSVEKANAERARFKQTGVPKAAVHSWYGQKPRRQIISQENYITWHDNGPPHLMHYTSLFICPMTGEAFGSGRYGDEKHYKTDATNPGVVWYKRKALAEHGAAARAFDCLVFREAHASPGVTPPIYQIGDDEPYLAAKVMGGSSSSMKDDSAVGAVPSHVPPNVRSKVEQAIRKGKAFKMQGIPEAHATAANQDDGGNVEEAGWNKNPAERQQDFEMRRQQQQQQQQQQQHQQKSFGSMEHSIFGDPS